MNDSSRPDELRRPEVILVNRFLPDPLLVLLDAPRSAAAEEYRKVVVDAFGREKMPGDAQPGTLAVISPLPGEGKTLTSVNIALALAEHYPRRVLLVDFDLRRPSVEKFLAEKRRRGLADALRGRVTLEGAIQNCGREKLSVLTAGWQPDSVAQRLDARTIASTLERLRERFDVVVIDCPPLLPFAETRSLARTADHVLLVARAETTPRNALKEAAEILDPDRLIGVLLNGIPAHRWQRYGYRYGYRWRKDPESD